MKSSLKSKSLTIGGGVLRRGGIIAYPTEGVWGLGCDPNNEAAVAQILALKGRARGKGLILAAASMEQIEPLLRGLSEFHRDILSQSWPGPHTWLIPDLEGLIPPWIKGDFETVALRVSAHSVVQGLCREFGGPIVSTSANPADAEPALDQRTVGAYFPTGIDYIVAGELGRQSGPSEIRDLLSQRRIR